MTDARKNASVFGNSGQNDPWVLVRTPTGEPWSGRTRYAAAMDLYKAGEMSAETLEVYRICSRLDDEDPLDVLRRWRVGVNWLKRMEQEDDARRGASD